MRCFGGKGRLVGSGTSVRGAGTARRLRAAPPSTGRLRGGGATVRVADEGGQGRSDARPGRPRRGGDVEGSFEGESSPARDAPGAPQRVRAALGRGGRGTRRHPV